jgi:hypothetical protein
MSDTEPDLSEFFASAICAWRQSREVQALLRLKDECRRFRRYCVSCKEEITGLEQQQRENFARSARHDDIVRVGQSLDHTKSRSDRAESEAKRIENSADLARAVEVARQCLVT